MLLSYEIEFLRVTFRLQRVYLRVFWVLWGVYGLPRGALKFLMVIFGRKHGNIVFPE